MPAGDSRGVHDVIDTHGRAFTSPSGQVVGFVYHLLDRREGGGGPAGFRVYFLPYVLYVLFCEDELFHHVRALRPCTALEILDYGNVLPL